MAGGDHGLGAFVVGCKLIVTLNGKVARIDDVESLCDTDTDDDEEDDVIESFSFEISVAEVICRKDNSVVLAKTIKKKLTEGLKTVALDDLRIFEDDEGLVDCEFVERTESTEASENESLLRVVVYVTGDLAFYAIVLGREGMSGKHCYLCQLSASEYKDLLQSGEPWSNDKMQAIVKGLKTSKKKKKKTTRKRKRVEEEKDPEDNDEGHQDARLDPHMGMKEDPWFPFIPVQNFVVPLLHCLIGIGNDLLKRLRWFISEEIEYISPMEIEVGGILSSLEVKLASLRLERGHFDASEDGKLLKKLKARVTAANKELKKLGVISENVAACSSSSISPYQDYLDNVFDFIESATETALASLPAEHSEYIDIVD